VVIYVSVHEVVGASTYVRTKLVVLKIYVQKTRFIVMNRNRTRALASVAR
jgi:hypothetical protein